MNPSNRRDSSTMAEEIQVLGAISHVSVWLVRRLAALANLRQSQKGGIMHEPNERDDLGHQRYPEHRCYHQRSRRLAGIAVQRFRRGIACRECSCRGGSVRRTASRSPDRDQAGTDRAMQADKSCVRYTTAVRNHCHAETARQDPV